MVQVMKLLFKVDNQQTIRPGKTKLFITLSKFKLAQLVKFILALIEEKLDHVSLSPPSFLSCK